MWFEAKKHMSKGRAEQKSAGSIYILQRFVLGAMTIAISNPALDSAVDIIPAKMTVCGELT